VAAGALNTCLPLLRLLADGRPHSGEALAEALGISRAAVWKQIARLKNLGLKIDSRIGSGYRLSRPIEFLDRAFIARELNGPEGCSSRIEVFTEIDSTNSHLFSRERPAPGELGVCLAEFQRGGRGRRGRSWVAPLGGGLCLSLAWTFAAQPADCGALGLAAGVVVRRVLEGLTGLKLKIKWPNDLIWEHRKLAGILVELSAEGHGPCLAVVGVGINVSMDSTALDEIGSSGADAVDLASAMQGSSPSRNRLAVRLINELSMLLRSYDSTGFAPYLDELLAVDYLRGRGVKVLGDAHSVSGTAAGIAADGGLLVDTVEGVRKILSGEVSVRAMT